MKLKFYKKIFTLLSFLTDKTGGVSQLVKYKLILGSIILVLTNTSCHTKQDPYVSCYVPVYEDNDSIAEVIESVDSIENSVENSVSTKI